MSKRFLFSFLIIFIGLPFLFLGKAATVAIASLPTEIQNLKMSSIETNPKDGAEIVYVPEGKFEMGTNDGDKKEQPAHTVYLIGFWIYKTEVTNAQFLNFINETDYETDGEKGGCGYVYNWDEKKWECVKKADWRHPHGSRSKMEGEDHPVVQMSWNDAREYCRWAGGDLPSEAQWEKAARGTDGRQYPWGNEIPGGEKSRVNFADKNFNSGWADKNIDDGWKYTAPVGSYPDGASRYGALDMAGNVWEWVNDWYDETYYTSDVEWNDPQGPSDGDYRVVRGGSWSNDSKLIRAAFRNWYDPNDRYDNYGFRCALNEIP